MFEFLLLLVLVSYLPGVLLWLLRFERAPDLRLMPRGARVFVAPMLCNLIGSLSGMSGAAAVTLDGFTVVVASRRAANWVTLKHEAVHVRQARVLGPFYLLSYVLLYLWRLVTEWRELRWLGITGWLRAAYREHPFEVAARRAAGQA